MTRWTMRNMARGAALAALVALGGCAAYPDDYATGNYDYPVYGGYYDPGFAVSDWGGGGWGGYEGWHHGDWHHGDWHGGGSHVPAAWHQPGGFAHSGFGGGHGVAMAHAGGGGHFGGGHGGRG